MTENKTYIIVCKRGLTKQDCPHFTQQQVLCVECPYAAYFPRQHQEKTEQEENQKDDRR